jgi:aspartyl/asparaginyl beta-hydroxylase (cupin superfamily)
MSYLTEQDLTPMPVMIVDSSDSFDNLMNKLNTLSRENAKLHDELMKKNAIINDVKAKMNTLFTQQCNFLKQFEKAFESEEDQPTETMKLYVEAATYAALTFGRKGAIISRVKKRLEMMPWDK